MGKKRGTGEISVVQPNSIDPAKSLSERNEEIMKNRFDVFIHNVEYLCKINGISQNDLCMKKMGGLLSPPQLAGYKREEKDIPFRVISLIATAFELPVEDIIGKVLETQTNVNDNLDNTFSRPKSEFEKCVGTYDLAYFNTSRPLGENTIPISHSLNYAILTIYGTSTPVGSTAFHVVAFFNCSDTERNQIVSMLNTVDLLNYGSRAYEIYEAVALEDEKSRAKCLYRGDINLTEQMIELTLHQVNGNDTAHLFAHNRAATSSEGKKYKGGLFTMMSVSRGAEHMPCVQSAILLRGIHGDTFTDNNTIISLSQNPFSLLPEEQIAAHLYMTPPNIDVTDEVTDIVRYMRFLYSKDSESEVISGMKEADRKFCLDSYVEKKLTDSLRRNIIAYFKVATQMDTAIYELTRRIY